MILFGLALHCLSELLFISVRVTQPILSGLVFSSAHWATQARLFSSVPLATPILLSGQVFSLVVSIS